jgi:hypothetical protein
MEREEMKRLYLEHREVEEARDPDAVVATFDEDCFLENVALGTRATGPDAVRRSYQALFGAFPDLTPTSVGEAYGEDVFVTWGTVHGTMDGPWLGIEPRTTASPVRSSTWSPSATARCKASNSSSTSPPSAVAPASRSTRCSSEQRPHDSRRRNQSWSLRQTAADRSDRRVARGEHTADRRGHPAHL